MRNGRCSAQSRPRARSLRITISERSSPRVAEYMQDLDEELWKLGVLSKTRHNEVAPAQHEMAPIYSRPPTSPATRTSSRMEIMQKVADRHGLVCLLHEKPFAGVNGSGKHNNWSLGTDTGQEPVLRPGKTPSAERAVPAVPCGIYREAWTNIRSCCDARSPLPATTTASARSEAPPAIISMFLGDELEEHTRVHRRRHGLHRKEQTSMLRIGVDVSAAHSRATPPTATAPRPLPSPATNSSSACPARASP